MSYMALYRKYRPQTFEEMVGQEHITKILKKQIETGKISHAYIFSGTRGTGKTTTAKVFARAINCLNPKNSEPCNECESCKSILDGNSTDVVEMDAASNNSVENIRSIRQEVAYCTTGLKYKVYIIDEVHMLSTSAFNALLKTLEEPPKNVVFILATTEEHKVLPTILSRCIRFEFKKISSSDIVKRLKEVLVDYNIEYDIEALEKIAILADGGMRDALSILERCINSVDKKISLSKIEELIGTIPKELVEGLVSSTLEYNIEKVLDVVNDILKSGKDLRNIANNITERYLELLVALNSKKYDALSDNLKNVIEKVSTIRVHNIIKHMSKLDDDMRQSTNTNILFKAKMLELATKTVSVEEDKLLAKIEELELRIEQLENSPNQILTDINVEKQNDKMEEGKIEKPVKVAEIKLDKKELKTLDKIMKKAVESDNLKLYSALTSVKAYENTDTITFTTTNAFAYGVLNKDTTRESLKKIVLDELDKDCNITIEYIKEGKKENTNKFEEIMKGTGVPFEVID